MPSATLQGRLDRFVSELDVPGAVAGILVDGEITEAASGVLNRRTGVEATTDSLFQIGSTTKVWTATLVMQLVDEGAVDLDAPVRRYLPDFRLRDQTVTRQVTVRHLLTHTSGIEGDVFDDFGSDDDAIQRYVAGLADQGSIHAPGETWSYCNSGWVVAGRLVEQLRGVTWAQAVRERIAEPLGLRTVCTDAEEAILHRAAVGHIKPPDSNELVVTPKWRLPGALAPAGHIITTASDLLIFAGMHLEGGQGADGTRVLSPHSVELMQEPHVVCPDPLLATHWGLGWFIQRDDGPAAIGHGGSTLGQNTYFYVVPERMVAVALLTNAGGRGEASEQFVRQMLEQHAGVTLPSRPRPADEEVAADLTRFSGTYERRGVRIEIEAAEGELNGTLEFSGVLAATLGVSAPFAFTAQPAALDEGLFVTRLPQLGQGWIPLRFSGGDPTDDSRFVHTGGRAARRVD